MRRTDREMRPEDARRVLKEGQYGVLSVAGKDGAPYGVPLNYFYVPEENAVYFHCAAVGRKLDCLRENRRVSFAVVGSQKIVPERFTTRYESVILTGRASLITDPAEKTKRLVQLCRALAPDAVRRRDEVIRRQLAAVAVVKVEILELTGKRNRGA